MTETGLEERLDEIADQDGRYHSMAYRFIFDSLDYVLYSLGKHQRPIGDRHVSVEQMLNGVREFALDQFGPLARVVFEHWGLYNTQDIGEIVFNLVDGGLLNKQDSDNKEDFIDCFSFQDVFEKEYTPEIPWQAMT